MRIKFLVVLAVICYFAQHASASGMGGEKKKDEGKKKDVAPPAPKPADKPAPKPAKPESSEYEVEVVKHKKEHTEKKEKEKKTHVEIKKEVKKKEHKVVACSDLPKVKQAKEDCSKDAPKGFLPNFKITCEEECTWECNYDAIPAPPGEKKEEKKEKKVVKVVKPPKEKKEKKPQKECSGEKVIKFQNCLVKIRGLIAFGDKTKNFDKKFAKLVAKKQKKGAKKAKGGKKPAPKKTATPKGGAPKAAQA